MTFQLSLRMAPGWPPAAAMHVEHGTIDLRGLQPTWGCSANSTPQYSNANVTQAVNTI